MVIIIPGINYDFGQFTAGACWNFLHLGLLILSRNVNGIHHSMLQLHQPDEIYSINQCWERNQSVLIERSKRVLCILRVLIHRTYGLRVSDILGESGQYS